MNSSASHPLVSFIIPCYNQGNLIVETVMSALNQQYANIEVWVINDGSTDAATLEALKNLPANVQQVSIENAGPSVARNLAVKQCKGKYIVPLDGDDLILPDTLEKAIPILESNESIAVVYGNNQLFGAKNELIMQTNFSILLIGIPRQLYPIHSHVGFHNSRRFYILCINDRKCYKRTSIFWPINNWRYVTNFTFLP